MAPNELLLLSDQLLRVPLPASPAPVVNTTVRLPPPSSPPPPRPPRIDWVAVLGRAADGGVLIVRSSPNILRSLKRGDEFQSWEVMDFDAERVIVRQDKHRLTIPLVRKSAIE